MEQISSGAEEAASAAQETLAVANNTAATLAQARDWAESARRRTDALQTLLVETTNQIGTYVTAVWTILSADMRQPSQRSVPLPRPRRALDYSACGTQLSVAPSPTKHRTSRRGSRLGARLDCCLLGRTPGYK